MTDNKETWLKPLVVSEENADPEICDTAAIKELSYTKHGPKIIVHNKVRALEKLIDREDKADELLEEKETLENDGFLEALDKVAEKVCNNNEITEE